MRGAVIWAAAAAILISAGAATAQSLMERSASDLAEMVRSGQVTATELVKTAIAGAKANGSLNALITLDEAGALSDAGAIDTAIAAGLELGPLAGVPVVVKDNINVAGIRTTAGTPGIDFVPQESAPTVARLEAAGAIVVGKANMHELAFGITSKNAAFGAVANPYDLTRFAGGSSGGTAAAIAAAIVPAGLGTDTGGSVRIPAALTGIVGFRPSTWRQPQEGVVPISHTRDVVGPMARSVSDIALFNQVLGGGRVLGAADLTNVRLGIAHPQSTVLAPEVESAFAVAVTTLRRAGAVIVDVDMNDLARRTAEVGFPIALYEVKTDLAAFLERYQPQTDLATLAGAIASPDVKGIFTAAVLGPQAIPDAAYKDAIEAVDGIRDDYVALLESLDLDAVIFPTTPLPAQPIATAADMVRFNGEDVPTFPTFIRNTDPASIFGAPALSLPMGVTTENLPLGLEIDGRPDGDLDLLAIGLAVEAALNAAP